jgi:glycosyltransferase involved in cell wall biosynthesis
MKDAQTLIVGNFLSKTSGSRGVCEDGAEFAGRAGWRVLTTSDRPGRLARLLDMLYTVWNKRNQYRVAVVDTFSGPAFFWAEAVCDLLRRLGKPYILVLHGGNLPEFSNRHPKRVGRLLRSAAAVTAPSRYMQERMKPIRPDIMLVQNPIDLKEYTFRLRSAPRPALVWLRAFHELYNPSMGIQATAQILPEYPDLRLLMGGGDKGDGSLEKTKQLAEMLGISNSVEFSGIIPKERVPDWLQQGDIFLNTTNVDNTPVSVIEAMACGLCIVSTNVGGIPYLLKDGEDALLVSPENPEAMAKAVTRILSEPDLAEHLSRNARNVAENYDWPNFLKSWEYLFSHIACGHEEVRQ